jgi:tetratricopeptide (TPR) repeat protein
MASLGIEFEDFDSDCFPLTMPTEIGAFKLFMDMGGSHLKLREFGDAARCYHIAAKLKNDSYKPFLGFAKTYLAAGELDRAETALRRMPGDGGNNDPETHRLLAEVCRQRRKPSLAFDCLLKAFEHAPDDEASLEPLYFNGAGTGRFEEMVKPMKDFLSHRPEHSVGWGRLCSVYYNLGEKALALEAAEKCLALDPRNPVAKSILSRINSGRELPKPASQVEAGENGLTIDTNAALADLLDTTAIAW